MTEFVKVAGVETPIEVAQILNKIINEKGNIDLDNLSEVGEKRFSDLSSSITDVKNSVSSLTTTVNGKIGATVSKAANGYIKFTNGVIVCWLRYVGRSNENVVTLPITFSTHLTPLVIDEGNAKYSYGIKNNSTSSVRLYSPNVTQFGVNIICIGF